jgi:hypothetical protein
MLDSGSWILVTGFWFHVSGVRFLFPDPLFLVSGCWSLIACAWLLVTGVRRLSPISVYIGAHIPHAVGLCAGQSELVQRSAFPAF